MDAYPLAKTLHVLSATILFGTGIGIAFFCWTGTRGGDDRAALFATRTTVIADAMFTAPAVVAQPLTGWWLIRLTGADPFDRWLVWSYALYALAGACWLPVLALQWRMREALARKLAGEPFDAAAFARLRRWWFALGWPAFGALVIVVHLMITRPSW